MPELVLTETHGNVQVITLNRPDKRNTLNGPMFREIADRMSDARHNSDVRVVVLTGAGKAFCGGMDVKALGEPSEWVRVAEERLPCWDAVDLLEKPLLAAVNGDALGGGFELIQRCTLILASSEARFGQPEVKLGLMPGAGGTVHLTQLLGPWEAAKICLTGKTYTAQDAMNWGLVQRVVLPDQLLEVTLELAGEIAQQPPLAVEAIVASIRAARTQIYESARSSERAHFLRLLSTADAIEGVTAFKEKRPPTFKGE